MRGIARSDSDVLTCGKYVSYGFTVYQIEKMLGIPHSTVHWCIMNRLYRLNPELYYDCIKMFNLHSHGKGKLKNDWAGKITESI